MWDAFCDIDERIIRAMRRLSMPLARAALCIVYVWFGALKVIGQSPASPLVEALQLRTLPFVDAGAFLVFFGIIEVLIGVAFLVPRLERAAIAAMAVHLVTTTMPLVFLPDIVWTGFLVPTLEGQYIIKNIALLAIAAGIAAQLVPMQRRSR